MITCKAKRCNSVQNKDPNVTFHKFPMFDQNLLKSWLKNIAPSDYQPKPEDYVCSLHFTDDQFINTVPKRLIRYALPTIIVDDLPDTNRLKAPTSLNKRKTTKRKAVAIQEEESSDSDISTSDLTSTSDDNSESEHNVTDKKMKNETKKICSLTARYVGDFKEEDLHSPEKMKKMWNIAHREITEQRNKLYSITQRNKRLEGQVTRLKNVIRHLKSVHK